MANTRSGLVVSGVLLSRADPGHARRAAGGRRARPLRSQAGDDRERPHPRRDGAGFILTVHQHDTWLLYVLSALLMLASPFFTSGRAAILPTIATREELHTANSLTQTTAVDHA